MPVMENPQSAIRNPQLLFVHGWATDSRIWKYQTDEFSKDYEVVAIDLPGYSEKEIWDEPTLKPAIEKVLSLITNDFPPPPILPPLVGRIGGGGIAIGWSLGGQALLEAAAKMPGYFKALVLIGVSPCFVAKRDFPFGQSAGVAKRMLKDLKKDFTKTVQRFYPLNFTKEELTGSDTEWFLEYYEKRCAAFHHDSIAKSLEALLEYDIRKDLSGIKIPALIIQGNKDRVCPSAASAYLAENLPYAKVETFDDAGHIPFLTRRKEFNQIVKEFIKTL